MSKFANKIGNLLNIIHLGEKFPNCNITFRKYSIHFGIFSTVIILSTLSSDFHTKIKIKYIFWQFIANFKIKYFYKWGLCEWDGLSGYKANLTQA